MANNTHNQSTQPEQTFDAIEAAETAEISFEVPEGSTLEKLAVLAEIQSAIDVAEMAGADTMQDARAVSIRTLRIRDAGVLAVANLLETIPDKVVQAKLHNLYGGTVDSNGKVSKTTPAGDGGKLLKAAKAYRDAMNYCEHGTIPASWEQGAGKRGAIAELLSANERAELATLIEQASKINVSDTVSKFFRGFAGPAIPAWMNQDKLREMAEQLLVNAEYMADDNEERHELRQAYRVLIAAFNDVTK